MAFFLQAAFADINIDKSWSVYYWLGLFFMAYTGNPYEVVSELERLGVERVSELLSTREFGDPGSLTQTVAQNWLANKDASRASERANEALSIARFANKIAIAAIILSISAIIIQIIEWYSKP